MISLNAFNAIKSESTRIDIARDTSDSAIRNQYSSYFRQEELRKMESDLRVQSTITGREYRCGACNKLIPQGSSKCPHCGIRLIGEKFGGYKRI